MVIYDQGEGLIIQQHRDFIKYRSQDKKKNTEPNAIAGAQKNILLKNLLLYVFFFFFTLCNFFSLNNSVVFLQKRHGAWDHLERLPSRDRMVWVDEMFLPTMILGKQQQVDKNYT